MTSETGEDSQVLLEKGRQVRDCDEFTLWQRSATRMIRPKIFSKAQMGTLESYKWRLKWFGDGGQHLLSRRIFMASAFTAS